MSELHQKLGELLAIERNRRQMPLENVASELKIPKANLVCIESGDASGLPSELYFDLFAKSYATMLGIDYEATMQAIKEELGISLEPNGEQRPPVAKGSSASTPAAPDDDRTAKAPVEGTALFKKLAYLLGGLVLILIVFILISKFFLSGDVDPDSPTIADEPAVEELTTPPLDTPTSQIFADFEWGTPPTAKPEPIELTLRARGESWATVMADGDTAFYRTLRPDQVRQVSARYRLLVSIGVPSQIDVELNGQPVDLRNAAGRISKAEVTQLNLTELLAGKRIWEVPTSRLEAPGQSSASATEPALPERRPSAPQEAAVQDQAPDVGNDTNNAEGDQP
ncbi:MAG: RodZ domain-containing protein [bacterium]